MSPRSDIKRDNLQNLTLYSTRLFYENSFTAWIKNAISFFWGWFFKFLEWLAFSRRIKVQTSVLQSTFLLLGRKKLSQICFFRFDFEVLWLLAFRNFSCKRFFSSQRSFRQELSESNRTPHTNLLDFGNWESLRSTKTPSIFSDKGWIFFFCFKEKWLWIFIILK